MSRLSALISKKNLKERSKKSQESMKETTNIFEKDSRITKIGLAEGDKGQLILGRFIPSIDFLEEKSDTLYLLNGNHYYKHGTKTVNFKCLKNIYKDCPQCDRLWSKWSDATVEEKEILKDKMASRRYLAFFYIIDWKKNKDMNGKVVLFDMPYTIHAKIEKALEESDIDAFDITDEGHNFILNIESKKWNGKTVPNYDGAMFEITPSAFLNSNVKKMESAFDQTYNLDDFHKVEDYMDEAEMENYLDGLSGIALQNDIKNKIKDDDEFDIDLGEMDLDELIEYMHESGYDIPKWKKMSEEKLRGAIMAIENDDQDNDEDEPDNDNDDEQDNDNDDEQDADDSVDMEDMDKDELLEFAKENDLELPKKIKLKKMSEDELREFLQEQLDEESDVDDDDKEDEESDVDDDDKEDEESDDADLDAMNKKELIKFMKENDLEISGWKKMDEDELREAVEEALEDSLLVDF